MEEQSYPSQQGFCSASRQKQKKQRKRRRGRLKSKEELRIDLANGEAYCQRSFIEFYGKANGLFLWERAPLTANTTLQSRAEQNQQTAVPQHSQIATEDKDPARTLKDKKRRKVDLTGFFLSQLPPTSFVGMLQLLTTRDIANISVTSLRCRERSFGHLQWRRCVCKCVFNCRIVSAGLRCFYSQPRPDNLPLWFG